MKTLLDNYDTALRVLRSWDIIIDVKPQAKQSTQFGQGRAFTPKKKAKYIKEVKRQVREKHKAAKICGMIRLTVLYSFGWRKKKDEVARSLGWALASHVVDVDNLYKPLADALEGICFENDSQVVEVRARKIRTDTPCIAVRMDEVMVQRKLPESA